MRWNGMEKGRLHRYKHFRFGCSAMMSAQQYLAALLLASFVSLPALAADQKDPTDRSLDLCLQDPNNGSTGDQTACETKALASYDKRMNLAYSTLLKELSPPAAQDLKTAQRSWIAYRDLEAKARESFFETRKGSMYAPMEVDAEVALTKERALLLERYVRVLDIDGP
ncbi:lysozyme inhibitor LprI family protein [Rhizobium rhizogenes]|uniref:lysozyme inhibitor LprI family protein n=2 Tax=Rhizobium rhizogenes TaxID=359 RepID=UPI001F48C510|nr:lysozyme inhibitor LprI family protein [Rhizobium rhizogenes]